MTRRAGAMLIAVVLAGCFGAPTMPGPDGEIGPTLVTQIINRSARDVTISYAYEAQQTSGSGEGMSLACQRQTQEWGAIAGRYSISVDGVTLLEGEVVDGLPPDGYIVVRIEVDPDGRATVAGPGEFTRIPISPDAQRIACG